jgi:tRNA 2-thiocytidine biosynthesis protein TtcA
MTKDVERLAYWLSKSVNRSIRRHGMIRDGERVAVAVSGGKDSLTLLRLLDWRRRQSREKYELLAIHIVGDARGRETPEHPPLQSWLETEGYDYVMEPTHLAADEAHPLPCQRCTWNRRRSLFEIAGRHGCGVVAYGHHADDLAQTTLLNLIFHGRVETMAPVRNYFDGRLRLIRPLFETPEKDLTRFAQACGFPSSPPECPQGRHSQRELVRELLRRAQKANPRARTNLLRAGLGKP